MLEYPLSFTFRILAFSSKVRVKDARENPVMFVAQKAFRLKEDVEVFRDETRQELVQRIQADRVLDFNARYAITAPDGRPYGAIRRLGGRSIWKATYEIEDAGGAVVGVIHEENPWLKLLDAIASSIPFLSMAVNPAYLVELHGRTVLYLKKRPAVFEGRFELTAREALTADEEALLLPAVLMAMILERERG